MQRDAFDLIFGQAQEARPEAKSYGISYTVYSTLLPYLNLRFTSPFSCGFGNVLLPHQDQSRIRTLFSGSFPGVGSTIVIGTAPAVNACGTK